MSGEEEANAQPGRRSEIHPVRWLLLTGSRRLIGLLFSGLIFLALLTTGTVWQIEMETLVDETRAVQSLLNTLLGGIILFVSVVLSINTAVLSQEFGPLGTKQDQIEEFIEFQTNLEGYVGSGVTPAELGGFFAFILRSLRAEVEVLHERTAQVDDEESTSELLQFVEGIEMAVDRIEERLSSQRRRVSTILLAGLDYDFAHHLNEARRIELDHGDGLRETELESVHNVIELLTFFGSGRDYFATLFFKREVRNLSRDLLVLSLPVIVFTSYVLIAVDAQLFPKWSVLGIQPRLLYVSIAYVVALSPYVLLTSYMLRIVAVSKHTLGATGLALTNVDVDVDADEFDHLDEND